jgi:DNA-binding GntR family transcriptional regulator
MSRAKTALAEQAYLAIRERILRGQLPLGTVLSRRALADELEMSLLPVTEAVQRLEREGLLESRPQVGTRVRIPSERDVRERMVVREALECQAARLVCESATPAQRQELRRMAERVDPLFNHRSKTDPEFAFAVHSYHFELHMTIARFSGCDALVEMIEKNNVLVFNWVLDSVGHQPPAPARFHRDLLDAVTGDDPDRAEATMRAHIRYGREGSLAGLAHLGTEPEGSWRIRAPAQAQVARRARRRAR